MLFIRLCVRETKADQRDDGTTGIRKVVKRIRSDADATGQRSRQYLADEKQNVKSYANRAAKHAIANSHCGR
ncbi:hypothetical protein SDC9_150817 [bioreactor metagenome]|uniref:Uncharacterized protein n=1 Tax=bioreactor metagenome TaxID=1076179 RepID=A0A645EQ67_9ZZZZ